MRPSVQILHMVFPLMVLWWCYGFFSIIGEVTISRISAVDDPWRGFFVMALMLLQVLASALSALLVGFLLNCAVLKCLFRWSSDEIDEVYVNCNLPAKWLRRDKDNKPIAAEEAHMVLWEEQRKKGLGSFMLRFLLMWVGFIYLLLYCSSVFLRGWSFTQLPVLANGLEYIVCGYVAGILIWWNNERNYKKFAKARA